MATIIKISEWESEGYFYAKYSAKWHDLSIRYTIAVDMSTFEANLLINDDFASQFSGMTTKELVATDEALDLMNLFLLKMGSYPIIDMRTPSLSKF